MNAEEVDQLVKVDDSNALNSFEWLEDNQKSLKAIATSQMLELVERSKYLVIFSFILGIFFISSISVYASRKLLHHKAKAENLAKLKSSFLANMSHEIRTPLNGIIGFSNVLIDQDLPKESEDYVRLIQSSSDILLTVINDILDFSKIEAGKLHLEKLSFHVEDVVKNTIALFSPLVRFKSISISYDIDPSIPIALISDPSRIKQILSNLISNSVKFTKNGHIDVIVKNAGNGRVVFTVKDTGVGMSEEAQKRIFNAFEQEDLSTSRLHGGTGLGLAISKNLVNMLGGSIWVESKKDEGSAFSFTIPLVEGRIEAEVRHSEFNITNTNSELHILVAEDNLINQKLIMKVLEKLGYTHIKLVENGQEAIDELEKSKYDVILMDVQMPIMGGLEATRLIKENQTEDAPMIFGLSANVTEQDIVEAYEAGMSVYLEKPVSTKKLHEALSKIKPQG